MDYEKKYKEALERAKEYLKEYYFEEAVKEIFPELKDDRQGEQKPIEWDEYDEVYVSALIAIVEKDGATGKFLRDGLTGRNLRDELIGWLRCLKGRFKRNG